MAISGRLIRRRIKSVTNTRKITKAMELVAASKMRRAVSSVLATRPYADAAWRTIEELAKATNASAHPLLASPEGGERSLVILFASDRGLCGGFNTQLLKTLFAFIKEQPTTYDFVTVGKKAQIAMRRAGKEIVATFTDLSNNPKATDIRVIADLAIRDFTKGVYRSVHMAYTDYISAMTQKPVVRQLLPMIRPEESGGSDGKPAFRTYEYLFEPAPNVVLDMMLPRLAEAQLYQALLESSASEHSARMFAMRSASDAASDMIDDLTLTYNQARQAGITREIAEISSGKAALETA